MKIFAASYDQARGFQPSYSKYLCCAPIRNATDCARAHFSGYQRIQVQQRRTEDTISSPFVLMRSSTMHGGYIVKIYTVVPKGPSDIFVLVFLANPYALWFCLFLFCFARGKVSPGRFAPNVATRLFWEDIPFGLCILKNLAGESSVPDNF